MNSITINNNLIPLDSKGERKYNDLHEFKSLLNRPPSKRWVCVNHYSNGAKYLPIRIVEELLTEIFPFWQVEQVGDPKILANSIVISVQLKVFNPLINQWLSYAGVGAVPIELEKPKYSEDGQQTGGARNNIDFEFINSKALHKNVPAALSFAVNNAAKKIGRLFGSHLNSKETLS